MLLNIPACRACSIKKIVIIISLSKLKERGRTDKTILTKDNYDKEGMKKRGG